MPFPYISHRIKPPFGEDKTIHERQIHPSPELQACSLRASIIMEAGTHDAGSPNNEPTISIDTERYQMSYSGIIARQRNLIQVREKILAWKNAKQDIVRTKGKSLQHLVFPGGHPSKY